MERFSRGTLPPGSYVEVPDAAHTAPRSVAAPPSTIDRGAAPAGARSQAPRSTCDLATTCPTCGTLMQPEHAHYRCATCGYRDSCCF